MTQRRDRVERWFGVRRSFRGVGGGDVYWGPAAGGELTAEGPGQFVAVAVAIGV